MEHEYNTISALHICVCFPLTQLHHFDVGSYRTIQAGRISLWVIVRVQHPP